jgi:hypothetical protein
MSPVCTRKRNLVVCPEIRSVEYVAGWLDDPEAFRVGMAAIRASASSLIDAIELAAAMTDTGELDLLAVA